MARLSKYFLEILVWGLSLIVLFPYFGLLNVEKKIEESVRANSWKTGWRIESPEGEVIRNSTNLPFDFLKSEDTRKYRHWRLFHSIGPSDVEGLEDPTIVLGRIGESDRVWIGSCMIGSTGRTTNDEFDHWWWGKIRVYSIPKLCVSSPTEIHVDLRCRAVSNCGLFAGPIGVGEGNILASLSSKADFFRFHWLALMGAMYFVIGIYFLILFLLIPQQKYLGLFSALCVSVAILELSVSCFTYRNLFPLASAVRVNAISAGLALTFFFRFLRARIGSLPKGLIRVSDAGFTLLVVALFSFRKESEIYGVYVLWFPVLIGSLIFSLWFLHRSRSSSLSSYPSRYYFGTWILVIACVHDVAVQVAAAYLPFLLHYGFGILVSVEALFLAKEHASAYLSSKTAASERAKELAVAVAELRKTDEFRTTMAANLSHDLKSPLGLTVGLLNVAYVGSEEEAKRAIALANKTLERMEALVVDLIGTLRGDSSKLVVQRTKVDLVKCINEWMAPYFLSLRSRKLDYGFHVQESFSFEVSVDKRLIQRVLENLVANALKFTERGAIQIKLLKVEGGTELRVADSGIGIPEADRERIFDRYVQAGNVSQEKHGGTGIGLSFVKEVVELHGGRISVRESDIGGSEFVIFLPSSEGR